MKDFIQFILSLWLCMLAATPFIFSACFNVSRIMARIEAKEHLELGESIVVSIPLSQLHWMVKDREVIIAGELFDVKEYRMYKDSVMLTGLYDKEETLLVNKLNSMQDSETGNDAIPVLFKWFSCFADDIKNYRLIFLHKESGCCRYYFFSDKLVLFLCNNETPPPRTFYYKTAAGFSVSDFCI